MDMDDEVDSEGMEGGHPADEEFEAFLNDSPTRDGKGNEDGKELFATTVQHRTSVLTKHCGLIIHQKKQGLVMKRTILRT